MTSEVFSLVSARRAVYVIRTCSDFLFVRSVAHIGGLNIIAKISSNKENIFYFILAIRQELYTIYNDLNESINQIRGEMHSSITSFDSVKPPSVKSRTILCENIHIGPEGESDEFLHVSLLMLPGRGPEEKEQMARSLFDIAKSHSKSMRVTVEVRDFDVYVKN